jgi:uncharacterized protein YecT (DUF1311 family)
MLYALFANSFGRTSGGGLLFHLVVCLGEGRFRQSMQPRPKFLLISALLISTALFVPHQAQGQSNCADATTTAQMETCANARYQTASQDLADVLAQLNKKLDATGRERLNKAQAAWILFRDANADFMADVARGGTLAPVIRKTVLADMTEARSRELKKTLRP